MSRLLSRRMRLVRPITTSIDGSTLSRPSLAHLHHQGPSHSAVVHEQALPRDQTQPPGKTPPFHSRSHIVPKDPALPSQNDLTTLEHIISQIPLIQSLRNNPKTYKESRPHLTIPSPIRNHHLVAGTLSGPGKLTLAPYIWTSSQRSACKDTNTNTNKLHKQHKVISAFAIGADLCGHPGFVHGGLLTVLFDEVFARCACVAFPSGLGMTANLNVDFRKPALPDRIYILRAETTEIDRRKVWVQGRLTYLPVSLDGGWSGRRLEVQPDLLTEDDGFMVAEGRALFVEPKFASSMVSIYK